MSAAILALCIGVLFACLMAMLNCRQEPIRAWLRLPLTEQRRLTVQASDGAAEFLGGGRHI